MFAHADVDGDGVVSHSEMRDHLYALIAVLDEDGDKEVTREQVGLGPDPYSIKKVLLLNEQRKQKAALAKKKTEAEQAADAG